ncbi:MAG TPA: thioredoxin-disulfide reductase [Thermoanaerobaculia bacterium]|nr:thioredoxin-disulfide reductase [Thermoanaerobaculia bacterium]
MPQKTHYSVAIIGSGPAGLTAAIYSARAALTPLVIEGLQPGGQLTTTTDVENFPGFEHGIQGPALMDVTRKQAERFGAEFVVDTVTAVDVAVRPFVLTLEGAGRVTADALIVASGASAKYLGLPAEQRLLGFGVSACATCDGFFFKGKEVVVVGGGDTAAEEATFLTKFCTKVWLVHRRSELRASKIMQQRVLTNPRIEVLWNTVVEDILGQPGGGRASSGVTGVAVRNVATGERRTLPVSGYFAAIGHKPNTDVFRGKLAMDETGYLVIRHPSTVTSVEGIFAAGDVADPTYRQAVSAAGEGCKAAIDAERWLGARGIH